MDTLLSIIVLAAIFVFIIRAALPTQQSPQIIYIQTETPQTSGLGCLPLIIFILLIFIILRLVSG